MALRVAETAAFLQHLRCGTCDRRKARIAGVFDLVPNGLKATTGNGDVVRQIATNARACAETAG
jgi:hypothetical protein